MDFIFNEIITDLIQFDFFSEYKFRKRELGRCCKIIYCNPLAELI